MKSSERIIRGVVAALGITTGHAVRAFDPTFISFNFKLRSDQVRPEMDRFRESVDKSRRQLRRMQTQLKKRSGPESSFLIDAHLLILQDKLFVDRILEKIESEAINAEWAIDRKSTRLNSSHLGISYA